MASPDNAPGCETLTRFGNRVVHIEEHAGGVGVCLEYRGEQFPVTATDVRDALACEVIGPCRRCGNQPGELDHRLIEDTRGLRIVLQVLEAGLSRAALASADPRLHAVEQVRPDRTGGCAPVKRPRTHGLRRLTAQQAP